MKTEQEQFVKSITIEDVISYLNSSPSGFHDAISFCEYASKKWQIELNIDEAYNLIKSAENKIN